MRSFKKKRYWMVMGNYLAPFDLSLASTRSLSISRFMSRYAGQPKPWKHYFDRGYRCEKVTLIKGWESFGGANG